MVTWADKHQLSEAKKPFMAVYLKSRNGGNIVGGPSLQKHYRRRRRKTIESSYNSNPFQSKQDSYNFLILLTIQKLSFLFWCTTWFYQDCC